MNLLIAAILENMSAASDDNDHGARPSPSAALPWILWPAPPEHGTDPSPRSSEATPTEEFSAVLLAAEKRATKTALERKVAVWEVQLAEALAEMDEGKSSPRLQATSKIEEAKAELQRLEAQIAPLRIWLLCYDGPNTKRGQLEGLLQHQEELESQVAAKRRQVLEQRVKTFGLPQGHRRDQEEKWLQELEHELGSLEGELEELEASMAADGVADSLANLVRAQRRWWRD